MGLRWKRNRQKLFLWNDRIWASYSTLDHRGYDGSNYVCQFCGSDESSDPVYPGLCRIYGNLPFGDCVHL